MQDYDVETEYAIIKNTILEERSLREEQGPNDKSFTEIFTTYLACFKGSNTRRTLGAALPACAQQLTGLSFLNTYASLFFKQSGFNNAFLITTILSKHHWPSSQSLANLMSLQLLSSSSPRWR